MNLANEIKNILKISRPRKIFTGSGLWLLLVSILTASAQTEQPYDPKRGAANGASYSISDIENINLTNGNLMMNFPLVSLPAGRGGLSGAINLVYNSKLYESRSEQVQDVTGQISHQNLLFASPDGGWRLTLSHDYSLRVESRLQNDPEAVPCGTQRMYIWKVFVTFPDGSKKVFRPTGYSDPNADDFFNITPNGYRFVNSPDGCVATASLATNAPMTYYSADGSYLKLVVRHKDSSTDTVGRDNAWTLYFPDGSRYDSETRRVTDRNGNFVQGTSDQFGRSLSYAQGSTADETIVSMKGFNNEEVSWTIKWKTVYVQREYTTSAAGGGRERGNSSSQIFAVPLRVVDKIVLPAQLGGQSYQFDYYGSETPLGAGQNSVGWGELRSIIMPGGARADYEYKWNPVGIDSQPRISDILSASIRKKTLTYQTEYDGAATPVMEVWNYSIGKTGSTMTSPDGNVTTQVHGDTSYDHQNNGLVFSLENSNGTKVQKVWGFNSTPWFQERRQTNPYVKAEFTSIRDAAGNYSLTAIKEFGYDKNGNQTLVREYDWIPYTGQTAIPTGAVPVRITRTSYYNPAPDAADTETDSPNAYWHSASPNLRNAASATEIVNGDNQVVSRSEMFYDNAATTGNLTRVVTWDSSKSGYSSPLHPDNSIAIFNQYDEFGNLIQKTDARGVISQITFGDIPTPAGTATGLYPTRTVTAAGTAQQRTAQMEYDFFSGLVKKSIDVDNNFASESVFDALGRPLIAKAALDSPNEIWTQSNTTTFSGGSSPAAIYPPKATAKKSPSSTSISWAGSGCLERWKIRTMKVLTMKLTVLKSKLVTDTTTRLTRLPATAVLSSNRIPIEREMKAKWGGRFPIPTGRGRSRPSGLFPGRLCRLLSDQIPP